MSILIPTGQSYAHSCTAQMTYAKPGSTLSMHPNGILSYTHAWACTPQTAYPRPMPSKAARPGPLPTGMIAYPCLLRAAGPLDPQNSTYKCHVFSTQPGAAHLYLLVRCPYQYRTQPYLPSHFTQPPAAHRLAWLGNEGHMGNLVSMSVPTPSR